MNLGFTSSVCKNWPTTTTADSPHKQNIMNTSLLARMTGGLLAVLLVYGFGMSVSAQVYTLDELAINNAAKHEDFNELIGDFSPGYILDNNDLQHVASGLPEVLLLKAGGDVANLSNHVQQLNQLKLIIIEIPTIGDVQGLVSNYPADVLAGISRLQFVYIKGAVSSANVNALRGRVGLSTGPGYVVLFDELEHTLTEQ